MTIFYYGNVKMLNISEVDELKVSKIDKFVDFIHEKCH